MKSIANLMVAFVLAMASVALAAEPVYFADRNLKAAVEKALGISDPNAVEMLVLTELHADSNGIVELTGIEYATGLQELDLNGNQIRDICPLSGLTNLTRLRLRCNKIGDVEPLSGLANLTSLDLRHNFIADITPLSGLNLGFLFLGCNQISDISVLSGLKRLTLVDLSGNKVTDVSALSGLTDLADLWLEHNQVSDISALSGLTRLEYLSLDDNQISDISALSGMKEMFVLTLWGNRISDISALAGMTQLFDLDLGYNRIVDVRPLSGLWNPESLYLSGNQISDISTLPLNVRQLSLADNQISEISALLSFPNLLDLDLRGNPLSEEALNTHIPLIEENSWCDVYYNSDPPSKYRELWIWSTGCGTVRPGQGYWSYFYSPLVPARVVEIEAVAECNYRFVSWAGTAVDAGRVADPGSATTTVTVDADYTLWANFAPAPPQERTVISNVLAQQRIDASKLVDIYYDLGGGCGGESTISLEISSDSGSSWSAATGGAGDIGSGIACGSDLHIIWDPKVDARGQRGCGFKARITADNGYAGFDQAESHLFCLDRWKIISGVPRYSQLFGGTNYFCGPTSAGMVLGYWDGHGFPILVMGDAETQTASVNLMLVQVGVRMAFVSKGLMPLAVTEYSTSRGADMIAGWTTMSSWLQDPLVSLKTAMELDCPAVAYTLPSGATEHHFMVIEGYRETFDVGTGRIRCKLYAVDPIGGLATELWWDNDPSFPLLDIMIVAPLGKYLPFSLNIVSGGAFNSADDLGAFNVMTSDGLGRAGVGPLPQDPNRSVLVLITEGGCISIGQNLYLAAGDGFWLSFDYVLPDKSKLEVTLDDTLLVVLKDEVTTMLSFETLVETKKLNLDPSAQHGLCLRFSSVGDPAMYIDNLRVILKPVGLSGDIDADHDVDLADYALLAGSWLDETCSESNSCDGADVSRNGRVDFTDLLILAESWLENLAP